MVENGVRAISFYLVTDLTAPAKATNPHDDLQHSLAGIDSLSGVQSHWHGDLAPVFVPSTVDNTTGSNVFIDDLAIQWPANPLNLSQPTSLPDPTMNFTVLFFFEFESFTSAVATTGEVVLTDNANNPFSSVLGFDTTTRQVGALFTWDHGPFAAMSAVHKVRFRAIGPGTVTLGRRDLSAVAIASNYSTNL